MQVSDGSDNDRKEEALKHPTPNNEIKESSKDANKFLYSKIPIFHVDCEISEKTIEAVVLCHWDNIYGPKVRNMWVLGKRPEKKNNNSKNPSEVEDGASEDERDGEKRDEETVLDWDTLNVVARQALCSEIMKDPTQPHLDSKLVHCINKRLAMMGVAFGALSQFDVSMHSLVLVARYSRVDAFLRWRDVFNEWLLRCVLQLRVTLATNAANGYTLVREGVKDLVQVVDNSVSVLDVPTPGNLWNKDLPMDLIHTAVVAHLAQAHHSIVIGSDHSLINKMVHRLSQFSPSQHRHRHHLVTHTYRPYSPDLHVQGILKREDTLRSIGSLCGFSEQPSCFIDLDTGEVSLQCALEDYEQKHRSFLTSNLLHLWNESPQPRPLFKDIFKGVKVKDSLILPFLKDLELLPPHVSNSVPHHAMKMLHRKVLVLVQCLTQKLNRPAPQPIARTRSSSRGRSASPFLSVLSYEEVVKEVRKEMGLSLEWDWRVVLGCAEAMHPGLITSLKSWSA